MELHVSHEQGYLLANTVGPIDESAGSLFRQHLHPAVAEQGTKVVLDLSKSPRINSVGLGHLVTLVANANIHSSRIVLAACPSFVSAVLERSGLNRFFDVAETLSDAADRIAKE